MTDAIAVTEERAEPRPRKPLVPSAVVGTALFVFTELMLFSGLISAHVIFMSSRVGEMWPPIGQPRLPAEATALNTVALIASGVVLLMAQLAYSRAPRRALTPLAIAGVLGAVFVVGQGREWVALIGEGLTLTSSTYGAFFYVIVGMHALHGVAALGALFWAWRRLRAGRLTQAQLTSVQMFWYFVVLIWPVIYFQVYLG